MSTLLSNHLPHLPRVKWLLYMLPVNDRIRKRLLQKLVLLLLLLLLLLTK